MGDWFHGEYGGERLPVEARAHRARRLLHAAREQDRDDRQGAALEGYVEAVAAAEATGQDAVLAEALRRLAVLRHHRGESALGRELCERSYSVAITGRDDVQAAEALNLLAGLAHEAGEIDRARETYLRALALGGPSSPGLRARVERNLGVLANIQGDVPGARTHYLNSLEAFQTAGDDRGSATVFHNLGLVSADQKLWGEAEHYYNRSQALAERVGDAHLRGLCLLNRSEVLLAHEQFEQARAAVEEALLVFDRLGLTLDKADAYRVLGVVFRETGRYALAEARLQAAMDLALEHGSVLGQAEAARELALLFRDRGRNQEALQLLNQAHRLFRRLDARRDLVDVATRVADLESTFLAVVRDWGRSIESADAYTFGHCERVADYADRVGQILGLEQDECTILRLGAYLHDLGKVKVPHEILNKPGPLTPEEVELVRLHPIWGVELLSQIEFPWDIKPMILWHHERYDGSGYPDALHGEAIPLSAQIIGAVDVYDALTTTRSYQTALSHPEAVAKMQQTWYWWRPDVFEALLKVTAPRAVAA